MSDYPKRRDLDGLYFRVERDGLPKNVCFTDMTAEEQEEVMAGRTSEWLASLVTAISSALRQIGEELDLRMVYEDADE